MTTKRPLLTSVEAAKALGVSKPTLLRMARDGRIEKYGQLGPGGPLMFTPAQVARAKREHGR